MNRLCNFSAGPAQLPEAVLRRIRDDLLCLPGVGNSILEISHRSEAFENIRQQAAQNLRRILGVPEEYQVLFLQGGSRLQFSMIPLNLSGPSGRGGYIVTGAWSQMAFHEATRLRPATCLWDGSSAGFTRLPDPQEIGDQAELDYVYFASNETIHGLQFQDLALSPTATQVCDMSSDFLTRPVDVRSFGLLYACAQKNAGIAGLTIVVFDPRRLTDEIGNLPGYLSYSQHVDSQGLYNTPPTFAIYVLNLMLQWIEDEFEDLAGAQRASAAKSALLSSVLERFGNVYRLRVPSQWRSRVNLVFDLVDPRRLDTFLAAAREAGMVELRGHRSLGGIRVSIYNAMPMSCVERLADFLEDFATR